MNSVLPCTWTDLKDHIHTALCEKENLIPEQFPLDAEPMHRADRFCGFAFTLFGPRQIRLNAIWAADVNTVYFYDARGVRYESLRLPQVVADVPAA